VSLAAHLRGPIMRPPKRFTFILRAALVCVVLGAVFGFLRWTGDLVLYLIGVVTILVLYPFRYAAKRPKVFLDHVKLLLAESWAVVQVLTLLHWPYAFEVSILTTVCFLIWLFKAGISEFWTDKRTSPPSPISRTLYTAAFCLVIAGTLFRIQHWPYANVMLLAGLLCCAAWFLVEFLLPRREQGSSPSEEPGESDGTQGLND
jgi:hypothetical protein